MYKRQHLILADDCTHTVNGGIGVSGNNSLTSDAQSTDEGTRGSLIAQSNNDDAAIGGGG